MALLHLPARAPNAAALRLFGWLSGQASLAAAIAAVEAATGAGTVQRMIDGTLLPCSELGTRLAEVTRGAVGAMGWRSPSRSWWFSEFEAVRSRGSSAEAMRAMVLRAPRASSLPRLQYPRRAA